MPSNPNTASTRFPDLECQIGHQKFQEKYFAHLFGQLLYYS